MGGPGPGACSAAQGMWVRSVRDNAAAVNVEKVRGGGLGRLVPGGRPSDGGPPLQGRSHSSTQPRARPSEPTQAHQPSCTVGKAETDTKVEGIIGQLPGARLGAGHHHQCDGEIECTQGKGLRADISVS